VSRRKILAATAAFVCSTAAVGITVVAWVHHDHWLFAESPTTVSRVIVLLAIFGATLLSLLWLGRPGRSSSSALPQEDTFEAGLQCGIRIGEARERARHAKRGNAPVVALRQRVTESAYRAGDTPPNGQRY
jgi:hypothetical protein